MHNNKIESTSFRDWEQPNEDIENKKLFLAVSYSYAGVRSIAHVFPQCAHTHMWNWRNGIETKRTQCAIVNVSGQCAMQLTQNEMENESVSTLWSMWLATENAHRIGANGNTELSVERSFSMSFAWRQHCFPIASITHYFSNDYVTN